LKRALIAVVGFLACGGGDAPPPSPPAGQAPAVSGAADTLGGRAPAAAQDPAAVQAPALVQDTAAPGQSTALVREVFSYRGAGRDPFQSLLVSGDIRPLLEDLRLMAVVFDARYPARSVAVLRDASVNKRYDVRVDDELGRLRVIEIRPDEVVFLLEEFGVQRQVTLALRRRQEGIP